MLEQASYSERCNYLRSFDLSTWWELEMFSKFQNQSPGTNNFPVCCTDKVSMR